MKTLAVWIIITVVIFVLLICFSACRVAGDADKASEEIEKALLKEKDRENG